MAAWETGNTADPVCKLHGQHRDTSQCLASAGMTAETENWHWEESWVITEKNNLSFKKQR